MIKLKTKINLIENKKKGFWNSIERVWDRVINCHLDATLKLSRNLSINHPLDAKLYQQWTLIFNRFLFKLSNIDYSIDWKTIYH